MWLLRTLDSIAKVPFGFVPFALGQVVAIICFCPFSSVFDYSAGALWGPIYGGLLVCCSKGGAAFLTFLLVRRFYDGRFGAWVRSKMSSQSQSSDSKKGKSQLEDFVRKLKSSVAKGGIGFCIILRLSPLPSWVANYALPLAGVPFHVYATACVGMLPPLLANVYQGAAGRSMAAAVSGGPALESHPDARSGGVVTLVLATLQYSMGIVLAQRLAVYARKKDPVDIEAKPPADAPPRPAGSR